MNESKVKRNRVSWTSPLVVAICLLWAAVWAPIAYGHNAHSQGAQVPTGHSATEGVLLGPSKHDATPPPGMCPEHVTVKRYDIIAAPVQITLNRFGDFDPDGRMFVLADNLGDVRAQEEANRAARPGDGSVPVAFGLGEDPIQPMVIRANAGDCVSIRLLNQLAETVSLHIHGIGLAIAGTGEAASVANPDSYVAPGDAQEYTVFLDSSLYREGTHQFHSHGGPDGGRGQTAHGLFGAFVIETPGSRYLRPADNAPLCRSEAFGGREVERCDSLWFTTIDQVNGPDFREAVLIYHEIGAEPERTSDRFNRPIPLVDPITGAYKPAGRAINYRSEPFMRRLELQEEALGFTDESLGVSSYTFGDSGQALVRSYVGDPTKLRVVHGGSETFHVHHLHGGGIRWQRQPDVPGAVVAIDSGLQKQIPEFPVSERVDAQTIGPSEAYDTEIGCGAGGCQQSVGDFFFHCHVAEHYIAGMWGGWRVYNTLQTADTARDEMGPLGELPDRQRFVEAPLTSVDLIGRTVEGPQGDVLLSEDNIEAFIERLLPPQGVPRGFDASVWDWVKVQTARGPLYLGEPEDVNTWVNFESPNPGQRPALLFDPRTGKLAYPFLRPHLARRPPFAPGHGPAPFLSPPLEGAPAVLPDPGANGRASICPAFSPRRSFDFVAVNVPIQVTRFGDVDEDGQIFVLRDELERVVEGGEKREPLVVRANKGDCIDLTLINDIPSEIKALEFSKVNVHQHFVHFDIQGTDGVIFGFNFEQSVRPFREAGTMLARPVPPGNAAVQLQDAGSFSPNALIAIGAGRSEGFEVRQVVRIVGNTLLLDRPLERAHEAGEFVTTEFVRYRWFAAEQVGSVYFHDHVDALESWGHGLVGALIVEPPGSTFHHPETGEPLRSGSIADIRTDGLLTPQLRGSFREAVVLIQDDNPLTESSLNLRAEPLDERLSDNGDPSRLFDSTIHGDPFTLVLRAYAGDTIAIRSLVPSTDQIHGFRITGHTFSLEPYAPQADIRDTFALGISERLDVIIAKAGGPFELPGDYLMYNTVDRHLREGSWGILRVFDTLQPDLQSLPRSGEDLMPLPDHDWTRSGEPPRLIGACPVDAPVRRYDVVAIEARVDPSTPAGPGDEDNDRRNEGGAGGGDIRSIYALARDLPALLDEELRPNPLVLRVVRGECLQVRFTNLLDEPASMHIGKLAADPATSLGINVGFNPDQTAQPDETVIYRLFAHDELGTGIIRDFGNPLEFPQEGLYGAVIVEPEGAEFLDPRTGEPNATGVEAIIRLPGPGNDFREFVAIFHDSDSDIGLNVMPYRERVRRLTATNYRLAPLERRRARKVGETPFDTDRFGDPPTGVFEAHVGDPVRFRVLHAQGEQAMVFHIDGHTWPLTPGIADQGSDRLSERIIAPHETLDAFLDGGAGGVSGLTGDYIWGNHRMPYTTVGQWGILRVLEPGDGAIQPLSDRHGPEPEPTECEEESSA